LTRQTGNRNEPRKLVRRGSGSGKRVGRTTAAGVVAFSSTGSNCLGGVALECETDFVARNVDFINK